MFVCMYVFLCVCVTDRQPDICLIMIDIHMNENMFPLLIGSFNVCVRARVCEFTH